MRFFTSNAEYKRTVEERIRRLESEIASDAQLKLYYKSRINTLLGENAELRGSPRLLHGRVIAYDGVLDFLARGPVTHADISAYVVRKRMDAQHELETYNKGNGE